MRRINQGIYWGLFLLLAGIFLVLKNQNAFGVWGQVVWGGLFAAAGLIFLFSFVVDVQHWWRVIPGFVLLSIGASVLLQWQQVRLGYWNNSLVLFGMALAFWVVLLVRRENWWAELPAGVLTVLGVLLGLQGRFRPDSSDWLVALFLGLGLVFALLYLLRLGERETWWPAVPAAALILFAVVTLIGPAIPGQLAGWWPLLVSLLGLVVLVLSFQRLPIARPRTTVGKAPAGRPAGDYGASEPARGASVTQVVPDAGLPPTPARSAPSQPIVTPAPAGPTRVQPEPEVSSDDLYAFLKDQQQPRPPDPDSEK